MVTGVSFELRLPAADEGHDFYPISRLERSVRKLLARNQALVDFDGHPYRRQTQ